MAVLALLSNRRTQNASRELAMITGQRSAATLSEIRFADPPSPWACRIAWWRAPRDGRDSSSPRSRRSRTVSRLGGASRTFRMLLQSIILTVGALLVIDDRRAGA
jgi:ATP-binding cassette subfamily C protein